MVNLDIPNIDKNISKNYETAIFGLGWFWCSEAQFGIIDGVIRTSVGYSGGTKDSPSYYSLGDHTEVVKIDYNPDIISYEGLLEMFWSLGDHLEKVPTQYLSLILYKNEKQKSLAIQSKKNYEDSKKSEVFTKIKPSSKYYLGESYHQKYYLQNVREIKNDLKIFYTSIYEMNKSTAATRINGYIHGDGTRKSLLRDIDDFGLSEKSKKRLKDIVYSYSE